MEYPFRHGPWSGEKLRQAEEIWRSFLENRPTHQNEANDESSAPGVLTFNSRSDLIRFVDVYAVPTGRKLASVAGIHSEWQLKMVDELSRGIFFARRVVHYREEVVKRIVFLPLDELDVESRQELDLSAVRDVIKERLWKESVRARDYLATGVPVVRDLPRRYRIATKTMVLEHLEYLRIAEKSGWQLDHTDLELPAYHKAQIGIQSRFGRATFKY